MVSLLGVLLLLMTQWALAAFGSNQLNISKSRTDAGYPAIAVSGNGQHVGMVWSDKYPGGDAAQGPIYFKSSSNGTTLEQRITVDGAFSEDDQSLAPDIASDPNTPANMHLVWANLARPGGLGTDQFYTIYYAVCATSGATCGNSANHQEVRKVNSSADSQQVNDPRVATSNHGGNTIVHVVWQFVNKTDDRQIYYSARKADGTWTTPVAVSGTTEFASHPAIATSVDGGTTYVHVAWASNPDKATDQVNDRIRYCRRAVDGSGVVSSAWCGGTADQSFAVDPAGITATHPDYPAVAAVGNVVMVLWDELKGNTLWPVDEIYYAAYALSETGGGSGSTFGAVQHLGNSPTERRSDHDPTSAAADVRGSPHARRLQLKATAKSGGGTDVTTTIYVVWHQTTSGSPNRHDVYSRKLPLGSCGECGDWSASVNETQTKKLDGSSTPYYSMSPDLAVSDSHELLSLYMEGKEEGGYDINDSFVFDVIYNGTVSFTDNTTNNPADIPIVFLPAILK
jgi:hypothetical protein